jgi:hypothetical protein
MKKIAFLLSLVAGILCSISFSGCKEEVLYREQLDLFQPRFVLSAPLVKSNSIAVVWYKIQDADSYEVELCLDNYYTKRFALYNVKEPQLFVDDIPYNTTFFIRLRAKSVDGLHNSQWATTSAMTEPRPAFASLLQKVSKADILENSATIRWLIDAANPVDSISVVPTLTDTLPSVGRMLTPEEISRGYAEITGLEKNTLYNVNVYDTKKPRKYDKPYNNITFRTAGPSAETIVIKREDDLSKILADANDNAAVPEGVEYYLPAGSYYKVAPFKIKKGFKLTAEPGGIKAQIEMTGNWGISPDAYIASLEFSNIEFYQNLDAGYFFNSGDGWNMEQIIFFNCNFKQFKRGFWRHQGSNLKRIGRLEMENCLFDQNGGHSGPYGLFAMGSGGKDNVENAVFTNCTFMRDHYQTTDRTKNMKHLFDYGSSTYPIKLEYRNITLYDYAYNQRLINMSSAAGSSLVFEKVLIASASGAAYAIGANTTTSFAGNYATTDYPVGLTPISGTQLGISAADLFVNPTAGDLTIKDRNSPIVTNKVGDLRWLPK